MISQALAPFGVDVSALEPGGMKTVGHRAGRRDAGIAAGLSAVGRRGKGYAEAVRRP
ncbi:hypothetical protein [Paraburkholderia ultramafica]|uniref:hypothetical protein n=1 Tax=Paraburkholderia ultramafica TaxID=1544867 RepID=UPI001FE4A3C6|nr:hypothetical protein [Paraburkholderia ultramafica]